MRITFLTGAGMSAESGIATFRDALTGLWARFDAGQLATPEAFARDPALVWGWYRWRAAQVDRSMPNAGHLGIAGLAVSGHDVRVVTQNVDDLHERAGSPDVIHLHGSLFASRCMACAAPALPEPMRAGVAQSPDQQAHDAGAREPPPACITCGAAIRPGVVWFGESLPDDAWRAALDAIDTCDLLVVVGTSGLVHPAAGLPAHARRSGTPVLDINPLETPISGEANASWRMPAGAGIGRLSEGLQAMGDDESAVARMLHRGA